MKPEIYKKNGQYLRHSSSLLAYLSQQQGDYR